MFYKLLLLFTLVPVAELTLLIWLGRLIGLWETIAIILVTGLIGASLTKWQGLKIVRRIRHELDTGEMPGDSLVDGLMVLVAGALLLTPGVMTDLFGFTLLIPHTRPPIRRMVKRRFERWAKARTITVRDLGRPDSKDDVIDI